MDMHSTIASIHEFNNAKSMNMENTQNIYPAKIKAYTIVGLQPHSLAYTTNVAGWLDVISSDNNCP